MIWIFKVYLAGNKLTTLVTTVQNVHTMHHTIQIHKAQRLLIKRAVLRNGYGNLLHLAEEYETLKDLYFIHYN